MTQWVSERFGVRLIDGGGRRPVDDLVRIALRDNPKRAQLLVSTVLGKHLPTPPEQVLGAGLELADAVAQALDHQSCTVLGYAETATGLGHCVAHGLGESARYYLHSTRRQVAGIEPLGGFEEHHSHATSHLLLPANPADLMDDSTPMVLVDDELSTGSTALNTIAELQALTPRRRYLVAALLDLRGPDDRRRFEQAGRELGCRIDAVALGSGAVRAPEDLLTRVAPLTADHRPAPLPPQLRRGRIRRMRLDLGAVRITGRHGFTDADRVALNRAVTGRAAELHRGLGEKGSETKVLVLGTEEFMYPPLLVALQLDRESPAQVRYSTTTRSPVLVIDEDGYPIRSGIRFAAHDVADDTARYAYNVPEHGGQEPWDTIVVCLDEAADTPCATTGLVDQLAACAAEVLVLTITSDPRTAGGQG